MFNHSLTLGRLTVRLRATIRIAVATAGALALTAGVATAAAQASDVTPAAAKAIVPPPAVGVDYHVTAHTGNISGAGTDGNVYLRLYGSRGVSPEVQLDDSNDNFERNRTD